jgi:competence protein ComEC
MKSKVFAGLCAAVLLALCPIAAADDVTPSDRVTSVLRVRASPDMNGAVITTLTPGEQLPLIGETARWYEVRLSDGRTGYVAKAWSRVIVSLVEEDEDDARSDAAFVVHSVDVGTGLAIIVEAQDFVLVYDGGSNDDLGRGPRNRLLAYMEAVLPDVSVIDAMVLSHPHRDHVELLPDLFARYEVRQVWDSGRVNDICGYRLFLDAIRREPGVIYHDAQIQAGPTRAAFAEKTCYGERLPAETIAIDRGDGIDDTPIALGQAARMLFLHADGEAHPSPNENSLVVRLDLGETRLLLMGDAEAGPRNGWTNGAPDDHSIEAALIGLGDAARADVLVVGHHGSRTSSRRDFLDAVGAETFIVSSGPKRYGTVTLPDQIVIDELERRGAVWRTDISDDTCGAETAKIGEDGDGAAGGCDNIQLIIAADGHFSLSYERLAD